MDFFGFVIPQEEARYVPSAKYIDERRYHYNNNLYKGAKEEETRGRKRRPMHVSSLQNRMGDSI